MIESLITVLITYIYLLFGGIYMKPFDSESCKLSFLFGGREIPLFCTFFMNQANNSMHAKAMGSFGDSTSCSRVSLFFPSISFSLGLVFGD